MMWARDYLLNVRVTLPYAQMEGMEGMACIGPFPKDGSPTGLIPVLYGADWEHQGRKYRWTPRWEEGCEQDRIDFAALYGKREGSAYGLTYCHMEEGEACVVEVTGAGEFTLWIDGAEVARGSQIRFPVNGNGRKRQILIKCKSDAQGFSMEAHIRGRSMGQGEAGGTGRKRESGMEELRVGCTGRKQRVMGRRKSRMRCPRDGFRRGWQGCSALWSRLRPDGPGHLCQMALPGPLCGGDAVRRSGGGDSVPPSLSHGRLQI